MASGVVVDGAGGTSVVVHVVPVPSVVAGGVTAVCVVSVLDDCAPGHPVDDWLTQLTTADALNDVFA